MGLLWADLRLPTTDLYTDILHVHGGLFGCMQAKHTASGFLGVNTFVEQGRETLQLPGSAVVREMSQRCRYSSYSTEGEL